MTTFCCKACMRFKSVEHSADPHKPIQRQTCKACSEKIQAAARRNLTASRRVANLEVIANWAAHV